MVNFGGAGIDGGGGNRLRTSYTLQTLCFALFLRTHLRRERNVLQGVLAVVVFVVKDGLARGVERPRGAARGGAQETAHALALALRACVVGTQVEAEC